MSGGPPPTHRLSVIVPTLNEAGELPATIAALRSGAVVGGADEIVVSDSGSTDGTPEVARRLGARVIEPARPLPSRGAACRQGAVAARGEILVFLDADTRLSSGWDRAIRRALDDPSVVGGAFELLLAGPEPALRVVEAVNRLRYRRSHQFYGDQAVFVRASVLAAVGGYPERPLFESAVLCRRLARRGRLTLVPLAVTASGRRFRRGGILRVFGRDVWLWLGHLLRVPSDGAGRAYWAENRRRP